MEYIDLHTHSKHSFDGCDSVDALCQKAIERGLSMLAITDHFDTDGEVENYYPHYSDVEAQKDILEAKEKFKGKLDIFYGIELGQAHTYEDEAVSFLKKHNFEFVIASLHNLTKVPDFDFMKFERMDQRLIEILWERYLEELYEKVIPLQNKMNYSTMAHLTYPIRYIKLSGKDIDLTPYRDEMSQIFKKMIEYGIALEVNTSGLRRGLGESLPNKDVIKLYHDCGGEYLTIGSDAHFEKDIGANISEAYDMVREIGYKNISWIANGKEFSVKL